MALAAILEAVTKLHYTPEVVPAPSIEVAAGPAARVDLARLPEQLGALFRRAREEGKPVLLCFSGPG